MAKSRQQRRARRAQQQAGGDVRQAAARTAPREVQADRAEAVRPEPSVARPGRGGFVRESYAELRKVDWPDRPQVTAGTIVVIILCAIVGAYLWIADLAFQNLVERILI